MIVKDLLINRLTVSALIIFFSFTIEVVFGSLRELHWSRYRKHLPLLKSQSSTTLKHGVVTLSRRIQQDTPISSGCISCHQIIRVILPSQTRCQIE